jgi:hypothetical protein
MRPSELLTSLMWPVSQFEFETPDLDHRMVKSIRQLFLLDVTQSFEGTNLTISGWGYTSSNGQLSPNLKFAFVNGWNNAACKATGYGTLITDNMICASTAKIDTDACQGDSGG